MRFSIDPAHPSLPGHFPGRPVVPGVVVLDHVVDAVEAAGGTAVAALRLPQVKFLRPLLPGEGAEVLLDPVAAGDAAPLRWKFRVVCGADTIASGEVAAA